MCLYRTVCAGALGSQKMTSDLLELELGSLWVAWRGYCQYDSPYDRATVTLITWAISAFQMLGLQYMLPHWTHSFIFSGPFLVLTSVLQEILQWLCLVLSLFFHPRSFGCSSLCLALEPACKAHWAFPWWYSAFIYPFSKTFQAALAGAPGVGGKVSQRPQHPTGQNATQERLG